ncbi:MAG TPA: hypothetical protein VJA21_02870 [Verrucomicrobiae bacterium]
MKQTTLLKSLTDFFLKRFRSVAAKLARAPETPDPNSEQQLREALLLIKAEENSGQTEYRHWGLNE